MPKTILDLTHVSGSVDLVLVPSNAHSRAQHEARQRRRSSKVKLTNQVQAVVLLRRPVDVLRDHRVDHVHEKRSRSERSTRVVLRSHLMRASDAD